MRERALSLTGACCMHTKAVGKASVERDRGVKGGRGATFLRSSRSFSLAVFFVLRSSAFLAQFFQLSTAFCFSSFNSPTSPSSLVLSVCSASTCLRICAVSAPAVAAFSFTCATPVSGLNISWWLRAREGAAQGMCVAQDKGHGTRHAWGARPA